MGLCSTKGSWNIWENTRCHIAVQKDKKLCQIIDFACPYDGRLDTKELEKMEHYQDLAQELRKIWRAWKEPESQSYTIKDRCPWNNTHNFRKLDKGNRYWNSDNTVAENCLLTHCSNPPKGSWGLRKLIVTVPKCAVKTVCCVIRL